LGTVNEKSSGLLYNEEEIRVHQSRKSPGNIRHSCLMSFKYDKYGSLLV
jgi:hypothetical protein